MKKYQIIYADPPWEMGKIGQGRDKRKGRVASPTRSIQTPYLTMTTQAICALPIKLIADDICHLWLWATNRTLHDAFHVVDEWGFKYLNILTYNKKAGVGAWFVNTTQHLLFGYKGKLEMGIGRYTITSQFYRPEKHSKKPEETYELISNISPYEKKIELFARPYSSLFQKREGWDVWGNEVDSDIELLTTNSP